MLVRQRRECRDGITAGQVPSASLTPMSRPHHLDSLDVFRGATVAAMIVVNNPGDWGAVFPQLLHADWNGCTVADVVFPFFVFIMGCAMPFAFARRNDRWSSWSGAIRIIERR